MVNAVVIDEKEGKKKRLGLRESQAEEEDPAPPEPFEFDETPPAAAAAKLQEHYNHAWWGFKVIFTCGCHPDQHVCLIDPSDPAARGFIDRELALDRALLWLHSASCKVKTGEHIGYQTWEGYLWDPKEGSYEKTPFIYGKGLRSCTTAPPPDEDMRG